MWWCPEKADTRRKYRVLVLGCLRWGLHGPGCVPLTLSSGQDSIWYGLQSWALCIPFEGSVNVWHSVLFWEGYGWAEDTTLQTKHNVYNYCKNGSSTFLLVMNCFLIHPTVITAAINIQLQIFICFTYMEIEFSKFAHSVHTCYLLCLFYVNISLLISFLIPWLIKSNRISMGTGDTLVE